MYSTFFFLLNSQIKMIVNVKERIERLRKKDQELQNLGGTANRWEKWEQNGFVFFFLLSTHFTSRNEKLHNRKENLYQKYKWFRHEFPKYTTSPSHKLVG